MSTSFPIEPLIDLDRKHLIHPNTAAQNMSRLAKAAHRKAAADV